MSPSEIIVLLKREGFHDSQFCIVIENKEEKVVVTETTCGGVDDKEKIRWAVK